MLLKAASNLQLSYFKLYFDKFVAFSVSESEQLPFRVSESDEVKMNIAVRYHAACFKIPCTVYNYISLKVDAIYGFNCRWIGNDSAHYILYWQNLSRSCKPFHGTTALTVIFESD